MVTAEQIVFCPLLAPEHGSYLIFNRLLAQDPLFAIFRLVGLKNRNGKIDLRMNYDVQGRDKIIFWQMVLHR